MCAALPVGNQHADGAILSRRDEQFAVAGLADVEVGARNGGAHSFVDEFFLVGARIRLNGKLPLDLDAWAMAGDRSNPAAYVA